MKAFWQSLAVACITGIAAGYISSVGTVSALSADVAWIKELLKNHETRLASLERMFDREYR